MVQPITVITRIDGGRRQVISGSPTTFGRSRENNLVVGGEFTSRTHGRLLYDKDQWWIVNDSPNGTQVNGKKVGRKPKALSDRDVVSVSDEVIFEVRIEPAPPPDGAPEGTAFDEEPEAKQTGPSAATKRTRLWIGIGIYMVLMCMLFVFLATLREQRAASREHQEPLTREQIDQEIRGAVPKREPDERGFREELQKAQELANRRESSPDALYRAHAAFALALAFSGKPNFADGLVQRQYIDVRDRLIEKVASTYGEAYEQLRSNRFREAIDGFKRVREIYPDSNSKIHRNATLQRKIASDGYATSRRRGGS